MIAGHILQLFENILQNRNRYLKHSYALLKKYLNWLNFEKINNVYIILVLYRDLMQLLDIS